MCAYKYKIKKKNKINRKEGHIFRLFFFVGAQEL